MRTTDIQRISMISDVIEWMHFPRYWPFVQGFHRSPVNSPHKGQWRRALMFSSLCAWINDWVNNGEAGDLRRHRTPYDVTLMPYQRAVDTKRVFGPWFHHTWQTLSYNAPNLSPWRDHSTQTDTIKLNNILSEATHPTNHIGWSICVRLIALYSPSTLVVCQYIE